MNVVLLSTDGFIFSFGWMTRGELISTNPTGPPSAQLCGLLVAVGKGDREAYAQLFKFFAPRLKMFLIKRGLSGPEAEELVQETMAVVWRKARSYDPRRAGAGTWIFTIARNHHIDAFRRERRSNPFGIDRVGEVDETPDAEMRIMADERDRAVRAALENLSHEQLVIVQSSFFDDKPHSTISRELGLPLGTVKSRIRLAFAKLRQLLDENR